MGNELFYFVPGQVILHLEHPEGIDTEVLNERVSEFLMTSGEPWNQLELLPDRTITFPVIITADEWKISLALTQFKISTMEEYEEAVYTNQDELIDRFVSLYKWIDKQFAKLIAEDISPQTIPIADDISLRTVSPNWLTGGALHLPGEGGPGAWPIPASEPLGDEWKFSFPDFPDSADFIDSSAGEGVEVAILDTAHSQADLSSAYSHWPNHPLVEGLLGSQGMLMENSVPNLVPYKFSQEEMLDHTENGRDYFLKPWEHFSLVEHNYMMPDHGLFVAGIIHTIAPQARLKLYEVLNNYGVGSYASIYTGLASVLQDLKTSREENPENKLIINLSLVLRMPFIEAGVFKHVDPGLTDRYSEEDIIKMSASIREIFEQLVKLDDVLVVAAAGNDSHSEDDRPPARYPAVCPGVIGVGAMPKRSRSMRQRYHRVASYSNLCDEPPSANRPPYSGYVTLGGEAGAKQGILGVYLNDIPSHNGSTPPLTHDQIQYAPNTTGWAWWAGTSFATPIISGLLAAGWSKDWNSVHWSAPTSPLGTPVRAHDFLIHASGSSQVRDLLIHDSGLSQARTHRTMVGERVIEVRQQP